MASRAPKIEVTIVKDSISAEPQAPDSPPPSRSQGGFRAHLQGIGLHDLVMLQNLVRTSGVFVVLSGDRTGTLNFSRGQLLHAETGELLGDAAALEILSWREGEFINSERTTPERTTVLSSLEALLLRLARDVDDMLPSEAPLTTATGVRRRMEGPTSFRTTHQGLGMPNPLPATQQLAAAATPGMAASAPKAPTRAGEPRGGVTNVLISPQGMVIDGNGVDPDTLGSKAAYMATLTDMISEAMGSGDTRSVRVRHAGSELILRRYADGHVSATLGPVDPSSDAPPASSSLPPPIRFP
jgi:Domain of unknown function (DUF4388)